MHDKLSATPVRENGLKRRMVYDSVTLTTWRLQLDASMPVRLICNATGLAERRRFTKSTCARTRSFCGARRYPSLRVLQGPVGTMVIQMAVGRCPLLQPNRDEAQVAPRCHNIPVSLYRNRVLVRAHGTVFP